MTGAEQARALAVEASEAHAAAGEIGGYGTLYLRLGAAAAALSRWLAWSGSVYPDDSPGDVISWDADGTITLDDGITTWNPLRALAAAEAALRETREVLREDADKYPALLATLDQHGPPNAGRVFNRLLAALARAGEGE